MKFIGILLIFISLECWSQSVENRTYTYHLYSFNVSYQNEDIFTAIGTGFKYKSYLILELRYGVGTRRTFFQQALFSKLDVLLHYDLLKSNRWILGPSVQLSALRLSPSIFKPIQKYKSAEIGYYFAVGDKLKCTQSTYFGRTSTSFVPKTSRHNYWGYSLQIGIRYEV